VEVKEFWSEFFIKKDQPWKLDIYSGIKGEMPYSHKTLSGATILEGKVVGGDIYYFRDAQGKVIFNLDEKGNSLI